MLKKIFLILFFALPAGYYADSESNLFYVTGANVKFRSEAPLEIISAESNIMQGVLDVSRRAFIFSIQNSSFKGFNSELQRIHFNENYLETDKYPLSTFKGKIIEEVDFSKPGNYTVRAKGILSIHGIAKERIIRATIKVTDEGLELNADFTIILKDHNIRVPKVVHEKIASEILVEMHAGLQRKQQ